MGPVARVLVITLLTVTLWQAVARWYGREAAEAARTCAVARVHDGDTVALICGAGREERARIVGLDAPETTAPRCPEELAHGLLATERLRALLARGEPRVRRRGYDRYGRVLIRLWVNGTDVAETLVREGLAETYPGGPRPDWCARLGAPS